MCIDIAPVVFTPPSELYTSGDWYVLLSLWIDQKENEHKKIYYSIPQKERSGISRQLFYTKKLESKKTYGIRKIERK